MSSCTLIPSLEPINRSDVDKRKSVRNFKIFKRLAPTDADRLGESGSLPQLLHQSGQKQTFRDLNEHRNSSETVTTKSTSKKCSEHFRTVVLHLETYRWMGLKHSKTVLCAHPASNLEFWNLFQSLSTHQHTDVPQLQHHLIPGALWNQLPPWRFFATIFEHCGLDLWFGLQSSNLSQHIATYHNTTWI